MREKDRIELLEKQILKLADAVKMMESRIILLENRIHQPPGIEPLSARTALTQLSNFENNNTRAHARVERLSESIDRTLQVVLKSYPEGVTADDVAGVTGRSKNLESGYLQKLHDKHYLRRRRIGRNVYYSGKRIRSIALEE